MNKFNSNKHNFWKTIFKYVGSYKLNFVFGAVLAVIAGIGLAVQPLIIKYILDEGIQNAALSNAEKLKTVLAFCLIYVAASLLRVGCGGWGYRNMLKLVEGFMFNIRSHFFEHIQTLCMRFYDKTSSGELFNYIMGTPVANLKNFLAQFSYNIPHQSVALIISLIAMFSYDWLLTVVMICVITLSIVLNNYSRKKIRKISGELLKNESEASKYIDDMLHGSNAIKMYAIEENVHENFEKYTETLKDKGFKLSFTQWKEGAKPEILQYVGNACIYMVGAISCVYRGLSVGELVAFVNSMSIIMASLSLWFSINLIRSNAEASLDRINAILDIKSTTPENEGRVRDLATAQDNAKRHAKPCIEFDNVSFGYDNKKIFENFNCKMEYNKSYGLVGASGSGKTTITKLIMRLYEIDDGELRIHGKNIKDFSLHDLRKNIGIVPQDPFIFQMSIIENIRIARPDAPMQEIMMAMETARVHEFVNDLPKGWNTIVGDNGFNLSGGQKQRIAIARAILGKPEILIFDEATSALDNISEKHIQKAMEELMKTHTVIIIAHRLSTIRNADTVFVFDKGKIIQEGTYDELANCDGMFKNLIQISESNL